MRQDRLYEWLPRGRGRDLPRRWVNRGCLWRKPEGAGDCEWVWTPGYNGPRISQVTTTCRWKWQGAQYATQGFCVVCRVLLELVSTGLGATGKTFSGCVKESGKWLCSFSMGYLVMPLLYDCRSVARTTPYKELVLNPPNPSLPSKLLLVRVKRSYSPQDFFIFHKYQI